MAWTYRYVTHDGTDTWANATNIATPCSIATMAANLAAGDYVYVKKSGQYDFTSDLVLPGGGYTTGMCVIEGYGTTPGDGYQGRNTDWSLKTDNFPVLSFDAASRFPSAGTHTLYRFLRVQGLATTGYVFDPGYYCLLYRCSVETLAAGAWGIRLHSSQAIDCDFTGVDSGVVNLIDSTMAECLLKNPGGYCVYLSSEVGAIVNCIFRDSYNGIYCVSSARVRSQLIYNNTFVNCTSACVEWATNYNNYGLLALTKNMATDSGAFYKNNIYGGLTAMIGNRTRDNTSADTARAQCLVGADAIDAITTDTGDWTTDYTDPANGDFTLIPTSPGYGAGAWGRGNIGAIPVDPSGSSGGGGILIHSGMNGGING